MPDKSKFGYEERKRERKSERVMEGRRDITDGGKSWPLARHREINNLLLACNCERQSHSWSRAFVSFLVCDHAVAHCHGLPHS